MPLLALLGHAACEALFYVLAAGWYLLCVQVLGVASSNCALLMVWNRSHVPGVIAAQPTDLLKDSCVNMTCLLDAVCSLALQWDVVDVLLGGPDLNRVRAFRSSKHSCVLPMSERLLLHPPCAV